MFFYFVAKNCYNHLIVIFVQREDLVKYSIDIVLYNWQFVVFANNLVHN